MYLNFAPYNYSFLAMGAIVTVLSYRKNSCSSCQLYITGGSYRAYIKNMNQLKLPDLYTFHLLKLYYKLYRNKLPPYFENFIPHYGAYHQNLRNNHICLPAIKCYLKKKF